MKMKLKAQAKKNASTTEAFFLKMLNKILLNIILFMSFFV